MKTCPRCGVSQALENYTASRTRRDGKESHCKTCRRFYAKRTADNIKDQAFAAYGGYVCSCCGETEPMFLTIDHMNNDGNLHRKSDRDAGKRLYRWLKKYAYPSGFQVLCMNCNLGKSRNGGKCPHQSYISTL